MKVKMLIISLMAVIAMAFTRDKPAYLIYNARGRSVTYEKMLKQLGDADIIMFGELHNCPITHWLQLELTRDIQGGTDRRLVLGAEMFEADNQLILDEYLGGVISEEKFEDEARIWPNYKTDYKPLVSFAKENGLPFIATNIPRRYANMVFKGGFGSLEELSQEALGYIAPLPIPYDPEIPAYRKMMEMNGMGGHGVDENFPRSQAIKDATMAHFILKHMDSGVLFIHYNGSYHSDNHEGIVWYLEQYRQGLTIYTISSVRQDTMDTLAEDNLEVADFIIAVPSSMTNTH
jgi:uncharacterized iron-regulated protein